MARGGMVHCGGAWPAPAWWTRRVPSTGIAATRVRRRGPSLSHESLARRSPRAWWLGWLVVRVPAIGALTGDVRILSTGSGVVCVVSLVCLTSQVGRRALCALSSQSASRGASNLVK